MLPDGVLKEPFLTAPPAPRATEVTTTAADAAARMAREIRNVLRSMVASCWIDRRIGSAGQGVAKPRQSFAVRCLREPKVECSDGGGRRARSIALTSSRATRTRAPAERRRRI